MLKHFEEVCVRDKLPKDDNSVINARKLIMEGNDISALAENKIIKRMLAGKDIKQFLIAENNKKIVYLRNHLTELQKTEKEKRILMINAAFAVTGLVLICIPTPPTIIIGSIMIIVTSIAGLGIKYSWGQKIAGLLSTLRDKFTKKSTADSVEMETLPPRNTPKVLPQRKTANDQELGLTDKKAEPQDKRVEAKESEREKESNTPTQKHL